MYTYYIFEIDFILCKITSETNTNWRKWKTGNHLNNRNSGNPVWSWRSGETPCFSKRNIGDLVKNSQNYTTKTCTYNHMSQTTLFIWSWLLKLYSFVWRWRRLLMNKQPEKFQKQRAFYVHLKCYLVNINCLESLLRRFMYST